MHSQVIPGTTCRTSARARQPSRRLAGFEQLGTKRGRSSATGADSPRAKRVSAKPDEVRSTAEDVPPVLPAPALDDVALIADPSVSASNTSASLEPATQTCWIFDVPESEIVRVTAGMLPGEDRFNEHVIKAQCGLAGARNPRGWVEAQRMVAAGYVSDIRAISQPHPFQFSAIVNSTRSDKVYFVVMTRFEEDGSIRSSCTCKARYVFFSNFSHLVDIISSLQSNCVFYSFYLSVPTCIAHANTRSPRSLHSSAFAWE